VTFPWLDPSFRPRVAILLGGLSGAAPETWHPDLDERARELLRQRDGFTSGKQSTGLFSELIHWINSLPASPWQSRQQAETAVARYIDGFYNPVRRPSSRGFQSPIAFERKARDVS
jgi:transposase InsO family protein